MELDNSLPQYNPDQMFREMVALINGPGGTFDQAYLYLDADGARAWYDMANGGRYISSYRAQAPFAEVAERIQRESQGAGIDFDALGCGDGKTETILVRDLAARMPPPPDLRMYLLDISPLLLDAAYRHASDELAGQRVAVFPQLGSFHEIARLPVLYYRSASTPRLRVFALLGSTVNNLADEAGFFRDLGKCAASGDLALIDFAKVRAPADRPDLIRQLDPPLRSGVPTATHAEFLSGPLLRHCRGLKSIKLGMELTVPCPVPGSYSADCVADVQMHEGPDRHFVLWRVKRYDPEQFGACLARVGWEPIQIWQFGPPGMDKLAVFMLLRRA
jgi:hypothetical protein